MLPYFAYGSNLDPSQLSARCPSSRAVGIAELRDHELVFPRFSIARQCGVAGYRPAPGKSVWGVVYEITPADLAVLDRFEGIVPGRDPSANSYNRVPIEVWLNGVAFTCETYETVQQPGPHLPSRAYLGQIVAGARHHSLPADYVAMLEAVAVAD